MGVVSKTDENGNFIVKACGQPNMKMARHFLEWQRPEKWGKRRKRHVPHNAGVLVIGGDVTKKPEYDTTASVKARKWKSFSRMFREEKNLASSRIFELRNRVRNVCQLPRMRKQNVTIAGPSHKMRPSSRARALRANTLYPVEIREIGKELQLAGLELCRETFHEETP